MNTEFHTTKTSTFTAVFLLSLSFLHAQFPTPDWEYENDQANSQGGWGVATAGDINGDGFDEILHSAWRTSNGGEVYLHMGSADGPELEPSRTFEGEESGARMGTNMSSGDFNGDGFSDFVMGSSHVNGVGAAYGYYGGSGALSQTPDWTDEGKDNGGQYGKSISTAGDMNGDGYDDLIVSAYTEDPGGKVYLYLGSANGLSEEPDEIYEGGNNENFGASISNAGDVNGDGLDDILVGANGSDRAYVFSGSEDTFSKTPIWTGDSEDGGVQYGWYVSEAGDVDGDGFSDIMVGAYQQDGVGAAYLYKGGEDGPGTTWEWKRNGDQNGSLFGVSLSSALDIDRDGYSDVLVSAEGHDIDGEANAGRVYVFRGSADGLVQEPDSIFEIGGEDSWLGAMVAQAGDVNGDGLDDMIMGAYRYSGGQNEEGKSVLYYGWETPGTIAPVKKFSSFSGGALEFYPSPKEIRLPYHKHSKILVTDIKGNVYPVRKTSPGLFKFTNELKAGIYYLKAGNKQSAFVVL